MRLTLATTCLVHAPATPPTSPRPSYTLPATLVPPMKDWEKKQREFEQVKARAKELRLRLTCTICGEKAKLNCPCGTTQYCTVACQRIDWRDRGHRKACKKIRDERAAEAARAEAPTPPPSPPVFGPAPRSHADEVRARIAAEHEAARARREANPEPVPWSARFGSRCPICLEAWDVNHEHSQSIFFSCCARRICTSCEDRIDEAPCPLCQAPLAETDAEILAQLRRHVENEVPEAIHHLGEAYTAPFYGLVRNEKKAAKIYKRGAELGNVESMYSLAYISQYGCGIKVNKKKAKQLYQRAADRGFVPANYSISCMLYDEGPSSYQESFRYCKLAADRGFTKAEYNLAISYQKGEGVDVDLEEARRWYARAAAKGHEKAASALAKLDA